MKTILAIAAILTLASCAVTFDPTTGVPTFTADPNAVIITVDKGIEAVNKHIADSTK